MPPLSPLFPLFVKLAGRDVLVVGGGAMAAVRVRQLAEAGARVRVVAPSVSTEASAGAAEVSRRAFTPRDVDGAWLVVAAATPAVNAAVSAAADARGVLVNAVDDPSHATAYTASVVRRGGAVIAISTEGRAPALAALLREAIDALLPADLARWVAVAERERAAWKRDGVAMGERKPLLLQALDALYRRARGRAEAAAPEGPPPSA